MGVDVGENSEVKRDFSEWLAGIEDGGIPCSDLLRLNMYHAWHSAWRKYGHIGEPITSEQAEHLRALKEYDARRED